MNDRIHELKIEPKYLTDLLNRDKRFEIRFNDRNYRVGDFLVFRDKIGVYVFRVRYIHSGLGLQDGYVCMTVEYMPYSSELFKKSKQPTTTK